MATQVKYRRNNPAITNTSASFVGAEGEITVDLGLNTLRVHNGTKPGGTVLAKQEDLDTVSTSIDTKINAAKTELTNKITQATENILPQPDTEIDPSTGKPTDAGKVLAVNDDGEIGWETPTGGGDDDTFVTTNTEQTINSLKKFNISEITKGLNGAFFKGTMLPVSSGVSTYADVDVSDANGKRVCVLRFGIRSDGSRGVTIAPVDATDVLKQAMGIYTAQDGSNVSVTVPVPAANSNNTTAAPTSWVRSRTRTATETGIYASAAMPGTKSIDLELPQNNTEFTAPADGYVYFSAYLDTRGAYLMIKNLTNGMATISRHYVTDDWESHVYLPVAKGHRFMISYGAMDYVTNLKFIYANGASDETAQIAELEQIEEE